MSRRRANYLAGKWLPFLRQASHRRGTLAGELGLEPRTTVPKTAVLPLHHSPAGTYSPRVRPVGAGEIAQATPRCNASAQRRVTGRLLGRRPSSIRSLPKSRSVAQPGRAPRSGRGGRRFKSCHSDQLGRPQTGPPARCGRRHDKSVGYPDTPSIHWLSRRPLSAVTGTFCALLSGAIPEVYLSKNTPVHRNEAHSSVEFQRRLPFPGIREIIRELIK